MFNPFPTRPALHKPHPERANEPLLGSDDGEWIFESNLTPDTRGFPGSLLP